MNWDDPTEGPDIELALTRHASNGQKLGSLFVNPGGPGGSGFDFVHDSVDFAVSSRLQNNYDIVGWDPRGVGRSTPVTCFDDAGLDDDTQPPTAHAPRAAEGHGRSDGTRMSRGQVPLTRRSITADQRPRVTPRRRGTSAWGLGRIVRSRRAEQVGEATR
jgi:pimeloyl-ACP methyl ester carboxylesterase